MRTLRSSRSSWTTRPDPNSEILRWIRELQGGIAVDTNSRRLFKRYYGWVLGFIERRGFSPQEAEDLAQDTFLRIFHDIRSFRGEKPFESWLFAVAANICRNQRRWDARSKRAAPETSLDAADDQEAPSRFEIEDEQASPERVAFEQERRKALDRAVGTLPPQMRRCLALRLGKELKYREIATLMKLDVNTVKAHLFQARQRLLRELGEEFGEWKE